MVIWTCDQRGCSLWSLLRSVVQQKYSKGYLSKLHFKPWAWHDWWIARQTFHNGGEWQCRGESICLALSSRIIVAFLFLKLLFLDGCLLAFLLLLPYIARFLAQDAFQLSMNVILNVSQCLANAFMFCADSVCQMRVHFVQTGVIGRYHPQQCVLLHDNQLAILKNVGPQLFGGDKKSFYQSVMLSLTKRAQTAN